MRCPVQHNRLDHIFAAVPSCKFMTNTEHSHNSNRPTKTKGHTGHTHAAYSWARPTRPSMDGKAVDKHTYKHTYTLLIGHGLGSYKIIPRL